MWKKEILMAFKISTLLLIIPMIYSCATQKELGNSANEVQIKLSNANPYCGGAAPDPSMELPILVPIKNYSLLLYLENEDGSRGKELKQITTDGSGSTTLYLPSGNYQLWLPTKKLSLEEFIRIESPDSGENFEYKDKECFQAWREQPDFIFKVKSDTIIDLKYNTRCYIGAHPCVQYTGPYHP